MPLILTDDSTMPFGKYKGMTMANVPASYLHHLWSKPGGLKNDTASGVGRYIKDNLNALKKEHPDGIWD